MSGIIIGLIIGLISIWLKSLKALTCLSGVILWLIVCPAIFIAKSLGTANPIGMIIVLIIVVIVNTIRSLALYNKESEDERMFFRKNMIAAATAIAIILIMNILFN